MLGNDSGIQAVQLVDDLPVDDILKAAIAKSRDEVPRFLEFWNARLRNCDQFFVAIIVKNKQGGLVPLGIEVTSMGSDAIHGLVVENTLPYRASEQELTVEWKHVVDWRYRDMLMLEGGYVFRELLDRLGPRERRRVVEMLPFGLHCPPKIAEARSFLRDATIDNLSSIESIDPMEFFEIVTPEIQGVLNSQAIIVGKERLSFGRINCIFGTHASTMLLREHGHLYESENQLSLFNACLRGNNFETAKALIQSGFNVNYRPNNRGFSALHAAVFWRNLDFARFLLENGADPSVTGNDLRTPAFNAWSEAILTLLIDFGADINAVDIQGMTPLDVFKQNGDEAMVRAATKLGGRQLGKDFILDPRQPFHYEIEIGGALPIQVWK